MADSYGQTSLMKSAHQGKSKEVERILQDGSCDVMDMDNQGFNALFFAVSNGHKKVVDLLVAAGGQPLLNLTGAKRYTCLHAACQFGHADLWRPCYGLGATHCYIRQPTME